MKTLATNKKAHYDYEILETIEVGIELLGHEVKAAKTGHAKLTGSFVHLRSSEAWLTNAFIGRYAKAAALPDYDPTRTRRLLLHRRDLRRLVGKQQSDRLTIIPLRLYEKRGLVKAEIALARGKRQFEKRETIKRREDERRMRRARMA
ncbi:MAG: SsrA-binding protein SmpB [bacterium]|nr:SsrA-binding protein SmpB [bacterium]